MLCYQRAGGWIISPQILSRFPEHDAELHCMRGATDRGKCRLSGLLRGLFLRASGAVNTRSANSKYAVSIMAVTLATESTNASRASL